MEFFNKDFLRKYARTIVNAWNEESYKEKLLSSPEKIFSDEGYQLGKDISIKIIDGGSTVSFDFRMKILSLPLPVKPKDSVNIKVEDLENADKIAAFCYCDPTPFCYGTPFCY